MQIICSDSTHDPVRIPKCVSGHAMERIRDETGEISPHGVVPGFASGIERLIGVESKRFVGIGAAV